MVPASGAGTSLERALLLAELARAMGLDTQIGLGHWAYRDAIAGMLPAVGALDTAIVAVRIDDRFVWIDPTRIDHRADGFGSPLVEAALVVAEDSPGIVDVPIVEAWSLAERRSAKYRILIVSFSCLLFLRGKV